MNVRPATERLRDQRRREHLGRVVIALGACAAAAAFTALVTHFGWM